MILIARVGSVIFVGRRAWPPGGSGSRCRGDGRSEDAREEAGAIWDGERERTGPVRPATLRAHPEYDRHLHVQPAGTPHTVRRLQ